MVDGAIFAEMLFGLGLDPCCDLTREVSFPFRPEGEIFRTESLVGGLIDRQILVGCAVARRLDGRAALQGLNQSCIETLAALPAPNLRAPDVIRSGALEIVEPAGHDLCEASSCTPQPEQQQTGCHQGGRRLTSTSRCRSLPCCS